MHSSTTLVTCAFLPKKKTRLSASFCLYYALYLLSQAPTRRIKDKYKSCRGLYNGQSAKSHVLFPTTTTLCNVAPEKLL